MMNFNSGDERSRGVYAHLEQDLEQNLIPGRDEVLPTASATPMMEVIAPATLAEDYTFEAKANGQMFTVTVPKGGVEEGQKFMVPLPGGPDNNGLSNGNRKISVPVGQWKDEICNCFTHGLCHNHLWTSFCCVPIAIGQVISRLQLTWTGQPGSVAESTGAFRVILYAVISYVVIIALLSIMIGDYDEHPNDATAFVTAVLIIRTILHYIYFAFSIYLVRNVRQTVRSKYAIPESEMCPSGCEDMCCAVFCTHLATAQLLRHTTDYDTYHATCCTETGIPSHVPAIV